MRLTLNRHTDIDWMTQANSWHKKEKKSKKQQHYCQCWSQRYWVSVLSTRCGGCYPKGFIVAS